MKGFKWRAPATIVRWLDGDTVEVSIDLGWRISLSTKIRLRNVYAPELPTPGGVRAKEAAEQMLPVGSNVLLESYRLDKYGRSESEIFFNDSNIGARLVAGGFATNSDG